MKTLLITLLGLSLGLATSLPAQVPEETPPSIKLTASELDELMGPVALYPDALISLILPAATAPLDIVMASRYVTSGADLARVDEKPWDSSVRALTRYPETLKWLDENLDWTAQVGNAFIEQPVEVMESIQRLRSRARELGNLVDTPQQRIVQDETYIRIIPAQPDYIYEPRYDPEIIYYERPVAEPYLYFSLGFGVGSWLNYDCDWRRHRVYHGDWHQGWDYRRDGDRYRRDNQDNIYINNNFTNVQEWRPDAVRYRTQSRSVAERIYTDGSALSRTQSRDPGTNDLRTRESINGGVESRVQSNDLSVKESRKRHAGIVRPKPIAGAPNHAEGVKRNALSDRTAVGAEPSPRTMQENKGEVDSKNRAIRPNSTDVESKGRVAKPNSVAPGMTDDGKGKNKNRDGDDRKRSAVESPVVSPRIESPSKKEGEGRARADMPEPKRDDTPKRKDIPNKEEVRKPQEMPKRQEINRQETPRKVEIPKREEPKREEIQKKQDMPKRQEVTRQEAPRKVEAPKREEPKRQEISRQEAPKREEPKRQEAPKREEVRKKQDAPKRVESPKQEAPRNEVSKPASESDKGKGRSSKEEEEKDKKKKK